MIGTPVGQFVWVRGVRGTPECEKWPLDAPAGVKTAKVLHSETLNSEEYSLSLDTLAALYPAPASPQA